MNDATYIAKFKNFESVQPHTHEIFDQIYVFVYNVLRTLHTHDCLSIVNGSRHTQAVLY